VRRDGSHEWGREGSGDCGKSVVIEESGVSKPSWHGAKVVALISQTNLDTAS